jgi:hypothetical protein
MERDFRTPASSTPSRPARAERVSPHAGTAATNGDAVALVRREILEHAISILEVAEFALQMESSSLQRLRALRDLLYERGVPHPRPGAAYDAGAEELTFVLKAFDLVLEEPGRDAEAGPLSMARRAIQSRLDDLNG